MLEGWRELQARISAANPAPYDETPQYKDFMLWFPPLLLALYIAASYWITLTFSGYLSGIAVFIEVNFPIFRDRIAFLGGVDSVSTNALSATIIVGVVFTPAALVFHSIGYWRTSLRQGKYRPVTLLSLVFLIRGGVLFSALFWILFLDVPISGHSARIGMAGIFHWPIFPGIGSVVTWIADGWIFCAAVGLWKMSRSLWSRV